MSNLKFHTLLSHTLWEELIAVTDVESLSDVELWKRLSIVIGGHYLGLTSDIELEAARYFSTILLLRRVRVAEDYLLRAKHRAKNWDDQSHSLMKQLLRTYQQQGGRVALFMLPLVYSVYPYLGISNHAKIRAVKDLKLKHALLRIPPKLEGLLYQDTEKINALLQMIFDEYLTGKMDDTTIQQELSDLAVIATQLTLRGNADPDIRALAKCALTKKKREYERYTEKSNLGFRCDQLCQTADSPQSC